MTVVPLRCLHHIKRHYPPATFLAALHFLFHAFWAPPNQDLTTPAGVAAALRAAPEGFAGAGAGKGGLLFTGEEVKRILQAAGTEEMKGVLKATTQEALGKGAFGAPWLWVSDGRGRAEPFFGSDR
jgi:2-hydroxychromene-2-carboxylate isomerase